MFLFRFGNYFKQIWQHCGNVPSANLKKKSDYSIMYISRTNNNKYTDDIKHV